ncbi:ribonuclease H [Candidatus Ruthia magnifica str. Cm (Calyptogena magnifica)]|uniref:Ribonuclease H n=1 Tax=Ruthia magnifica subsp. Calyptogena magnifica TaxID=413404 RepID=RNH_RUTMC|nr:ribonuclease HI [Candidatus Ruthturnera calyptogenae]A1AW38.1 RecName: Full=Ribonuclease H; Short=RNase H [Candidatus Ruthia magnifica str. Cm (Calyptogena magnifica)]ABL02145.1 ribonuclease H [Candidatus Ruthia magnifica str. Cm (Calyptogena magnifica)]
MNKIIIYTDGGCRGNPGIGGWGVWLKYGDYDKKLQGVQQDTTNNQMELTATIKALEVIKSNDIAIDLFTDSKYVITGISEWIKNWKAKGWKTANKKPVKNIDLWQRLDVLNNQHNVTWHWVKGHSGDKGNDMADALANLAMDKIST